MPPAVSGSADVHSPIHQVTARNNHYVHDAIRAYPSLSSRRPLELPVVHENRLGWETSVSSTSADSFGTALESSRHFQVNPPRQLPVYHRFATGGGTPAPSGIAPVCQWEQCGDPLTDTSASGVKRHLRTHGITRDKCERGDRGPCQWYVDGRPCGAPLDFSSFPKHVSTVHLKATARRCSDCGRKIGRADSLTRHQRDHCPGRRREWPES